MLLRLKVCLLALLIIGLQGCDNTPATKPADKEPVRYDVYLCIGQSNMAGRGAMIEGDELPIDNVWILNDNDSIVAAAAPLNLYSTVRKQASLQAINPAFAFSKSMVEHNGRPILLVVNARSGSPLSQWLKGCTTEYVYSSSAPDDADKVGQTIPSLYAEAVRRCRIAQQYGDLKAILWHQGEANSGKNTSQKYFDYLPSFVADLRADLEAPDVPFIAGEIYYGYSEMVGSTTPNKGAEFFNPIIRTIGDHIDNAYWVSAEGCTSNSDELHFSRDGQILIGRRYAEKLIEISDK